MPIDYSQGQRDRQAAQGRDPVVLNAEETAAVSQARADVRNRQAREQHEREKREFSAFALEAAQAARKAGYTADAETWDQAVISIGQGFWPVSRTVQAHPAITRFQGLRSKLNYAAKNRRLD